MAKKKEFKLRDGIQIIVLALFIIVLIAVSYIDQLNKTVSDNIIKNISELAEHDQNNILNYVNSTWDDLEYLKNKFASYHCETLEEMEIQMNIECANSGFSHIYLVENKGKVYTDKFVTYDPELSGQSGRIDILPLFENGDRRVVARFDDKLIKAGLSKESILYGIRLDDFVVDDKKMVALVGISDISNIQDRLSINSFTKDGVSRGYSAVIDKNGDYIVNIDKTVYLNKKDNFFDRLSGSIKSDLSIEEVSEKMKNKETFSFYHVNSEGVERIVYCKPFEEEGVQWYFLSSVESTVFKEQNKAFLTLSMVMLSAVVFVIIAVWVVVIASQNKVITANAEAKARSAFLANMSHEIRTPLNGIIGLIYLLEKDLDTTFDKKIIRQRLAKAKATAEYLLSLINNILDISKFQAGKVSLNRDVISPDIIMDDLWSMQKSNIEDRGIEFIVQKDISVPWIIGDELMVKQVLINILSNAAKFTPQGGKIILSVSQKAEGEHRVSTLFTCEDTGCGMSEDFLEHIWDNFSQERGSNDSSIKGTGLGMAISKLLTDAMGGEISVESKVGVGSKFYVTLHSEISDEPPKHSRDINTSEAGTAENKSVKVLVAEDNELNAEILIEILESEGFEAEHAQNGREAVEKFAESEEGEYQLILMDMQMPIMDGCEATREIRNMNRSDAKNIFIFACTANNFTEDREMAEKSGMDDFLSKPIDVKELLKKIEECKHRS